MNKAESKKNNDTIPAPLSPRALLATLVCGACSEPLAGTLVTLPCGASVHRACLADLPTSPTSPADSSRPTFVCPVTGASPHSHIGPASRLGNDVTLTEIVGKLAALAGPSPATQAVEEEEEREAEPVSTAAREEKERCDSAATTADDVPPLSSRTSSPSRTSRTRSRSRSPTSTRRSHSPSTARSRSRSPRRDRPPSSASTTAPSDARDAPSPPTPADTTETPLAAWSDFESHFDCPLCYQPYYDPVTIASCGHTGCRSCLLRTLDHAAEQRGEFRCFVCRSPLPGSYLAYHQHPANTALARVFKRGFPEQFAVRKAAVEAELAANAGGATAATAAVNEEEEGADLDAPTVYRNVPLFVCNVALPGEHAPFHLFEPRYRLMLRRVTAPGASRRFGLVMHHPRGGMVGLGTMLRVDDVRFLPDGRALIDSRGEFAFRIVPDTVHVADGGYAAADVETVVDEEFLAAADPVPAGAAVQLAARMRRRFAEAAVLPPTASFDSVADLTALLAAAHRTFLESLPPQHRDAVRRATGDGPPDDPAMLAYWIAGTLDVDDMAKFRLLALRSPRDRLALAAQWVSMSSRAFW
ncbi:hypothetical protein H9P43_002592 [Blastocladiella emersonii ATCC 22665]|nr:hypothetical protein H9P43_002592 [Blastocladiella emersonii ATCC 22665]